MVTVVQDGGQTAHWECDLSFHLDEGLLTVEGGLDESEQGFEYSTAAVTGGTGDYAASHGTVEVKEDADGIIFTFKLLL